MHQAQELPNKPLTHAQIAIMPSGRYTGLTAMERAMSARVVSADPTSATRAGEFSTLARLLGAAKGDAMLAARMADQRHQPNAAAILRSAISPGALGDVSFAAPISQYPGLVNAFLDSLRNVSAFDRMLPDMKTVPLRARAVAVTAGATAYTVGEGQMKPLTAMTLTGTLIDPAKVVAIIAMSDELWRTVDAAAGALFARELRSAIGRETDSEFVRLIIANASPISSSGSTVTAVRTDLINALRSMDTDAATRLYILVSSRTAKSLAFLDSDGPAVFPEMTPQGGVIQGIPVLVSDGVADGSVVIADANAIAAGSDTLTLDISNEADVMLSSTPDSPVQASSVTRSLWQSGLTALKAERFFAAELLRATGVAVISNAHYGLGDSP